MLSILTCTDSVSAASHENGRDLLDFFGIFGLQPVQYFLPLGRGGLPDSKFSDITFGRRQPVVSEVLEVGMEVVAVWSTEGESCEVIDSGVTGRKGRRSAGHVFLNELEGTDGGAVELLSLLFGRGYRYTS